MTAEIQRSLGPDGRVTLKDQRCTFTFRSSPGVLEIRIEGVDRGQLGNAPLYEIARSLVRDRPLELFVDATRASMPTVEVSRDWTRFFSVNQKDLKRVSVLVSSKAVEGIETRHRVAAVIERGCRPRRDPFL